MTSIITGVRGFHVPQQDSGIRQEFLLHQGCPFAWLSLLKKRRRRLSLLRKSEEAFNSAKGSYMKDFDGNDCIDYAGSWGPAIIGHHADDEKGTGFGAPCLLQNVLAEMMIKAVPSIETVRFVSSVTEANNEGEVCAIILEPAVENGGFIAPKPEFLNAHFDITPDLSTLGKIIGGGLPAGAYGKVHALHLHNHAPSQFQAGFTGLAHTAEDIQKTIAAAEKAPPQIQSFFVPVYVF
ncbi:glutamate-1-semialdehyde 2,1-aminomutase [Salix suchowensis]|nr:glutamate-1-semialdehyde 2,1-aminomutase [Salix suchowensis]